MAAAREREATLLAEAASAILAGRSVQAQLREHRQPGRAGHRSGHARVVLEPVPSPGERRARGAAARAHPRRVALRRDRRGLGQADLERIAEPLGRLIDVAVERERVAERAAETEAAKRAEAARDGDPPRASPTTCARP